MEDDLSLEFANDSAASPPTRPSPEVVAAAVAADDPSLHKLRKQVPISLLVNESAANKTQLKAAIEDPNITTVTPTTITNNSNFSSVQTGIASHNAFETDSSHQQPSRPLQHLASKKSTDNVAVAVGLVSPPSDINYYPLSLNYSTHDETNNNDPEYGILTAASPPLERRDTPSTDMSITTSTTAASTTLTAGMPDRRPSTPCSLSLSPDQHSILIWPSLEQHTTSHRRQSSGTKSNRTTGRHRKRRAAADADLDILQREPKHRSIRESSDDRREKTRDADAKPGQTESGRTGRGADDNASSEPDQDRRIDGDETNFVFRNRKRVYLPEGPDIYGI